LFQQTQLHTEAYVKQVDDVPIDAQKFEYRGVNAVQQLVWDVGAAVVVVVGFVVGFAVGFIVGFEVVGLVVGSNVVGFEVVGLVVGFAVGIGVGASVGLDVGANVVVGDAVGDCVVVVVVGGSAKLVERPSLHIDGENTNLWSLAFEHVDTEQYSQQYVSQLRLGQ